MTNYGRNDIQERRTYDYHVYSDDSVEKYEAVLVRVFGTWWLYSWIGGAPPSDVYPDAADFIENDGRSSTVLTNMDL